MSDAEVNEEQPIEIEENKKKPGRPKKQVVKKSVPVVGIVNEPSNIKSVSDPRLINIYEIVYDNPTMFKKIFSLYKLYSVENILFQLRADRILLYTVDHQGKTEIKTTIYGSRINHYYLSKDIDFTLNSTNIQKIIQTLNKDHSKIYWFSNVQYERSKIKIGLSNDEIEDDSIWTLEIEPTDETETNIEKDLLLEEDYPIKFELPFKYFKKKIIDFKQSGEIMKIEKNGLGKLLLSYVFSNKKGDHQTLFKSPANLNLISTIDQDDIFSTSVYLDYLKPLASSLITDIIHISACVDKKIIFTAYLDQLEVDKKKVAGTEKCEIKILTETVKVKTEA